jgi:uncharacterized protein DUF5677
VQPIRSQRKAGGKLAVVLHAKARKTFSAILLLAREGYGEDALILARSLTTLHIDAAYLTAEDTPERVRVWLAFARMHLRKWATSLDRPLQDDSVNWVEEEERAKKWPDLADRAEKTRSSNHTPPPLSGAAGVSLQVGAPCAVLPSVVGGADGVMFEHRGRTLATLLPIGSRNARHGHSQETAKRYHR